MTELVLAVNRMHLLKQGIPQTGLVDAEYVDTKDYALLPRAFADNKLPTGDTLGTLFAQVLPYAIVRHPDGRVLTYQRKGKEEGLRGQWSIGVGGHISHEDFSTACDKVKHRTGEDSLPWMSDLILLGAEREIEEELGIHINLVYVPEDRMMRFSGVINSNANIVDRTHVAYVHCISLDESQVNELAPAPDEFLDWHWATTAELSENLDDYRGSGKPFESWSQSLIKAQVDYCEVA